MQKNVQITGQFSSVAQSCWLFATLWSAACQASLSFTISQSLLRIMSLSWWCYRTISSSATLFSFCLQSFPASRSFPMCWLFASDGQSFGASALASVLPMNIQDWSPLGLTSLTSLQSNGLSKVFSNTSVWRHQFLVLSSLHGTTLKRPYMVAGKTIALTVQTFVSKVMSLFFNMLSRFVITFLPRRKCLLS